ncbi:hypothetical protein PTTG_26741 [Puccinia triticina 1-1 BBBD Race 1]|uniref:Uncharacterized protein n=1 Tax=Puccinia triticina (isolate 1-1 / race 1 (BBBD)) TaxID=630390 RepID=A0A180GR95_PUCT1|nr:hypothetical protein PTTG_26741 [Puccinia triticina 1-1 BBBD Race 1]
MKGVAIKYRAKKNTKVGVSLGMSCKRQRYQNNGRPPNTTDALAKPDTKKAKTKSANFVKTPGQSYCLYIAVPNHPSKKNQCWMAAGLESLYALYTPLWQQGISGKGTNIFTALLFNFSARVTYKMNLTGSIQSTLTRGQNKLWELANFKNPEKNNNFWKLFRFIEDQQFTCEALSETKQADSYEKRNAHVISIRPHMFTSSNTAYTDVQNLFHIWTTQGIQIPCGRVCRRSGFGGRCAALKVAAPPAALPLFGSGKKREPATFSGSAAEPLLRYRFLTWPRSAPPLPAKKAQRSAKRSCFGGRCAALKGAAPSAALPLFGAAQRFSLGRKLKRLNSKVKLVDLPTQSTNGNNLLEISKLAFEDNLPPLHLNIHLEVMHIADNQARQDFMGTKDWPFKLLICGHTYTLVSQGYWAHNHYWAKMLKHLGSMVGVWLHNNACDNGFAQLINRVPGKEKHMEDSIAKIAKDNKQPAGDLPFMQMKAIINLSYNSVLIPHSPSQPPVTSPAPPSIKPSKKPVSATFLALASKKASNSLLPDISDLLGRSKPSPDVPDVSAETSDPPEVKKPVLLKFKLKLQPQDLPKVLPPPTVMSPNLAPLNNSVWPAKKGKVLPCPPPQDTWAT